MVGVVRSCAVGFGKVDFLISGVTDVTDVTENSTQFSNIENQVKNSVTSVTSVTKNLLKFNYVVWSGEFGWVQPGGVGYSGIRFSVVRQKIKKTKKTKNHLRISNFITSNTPKLPPLSGL